MREIIIVFAAVALACDSDPVPVHATDPIAQESLARASAILQINLEEVTPREAVIEARGIESCSPRGCRWTVTDRCSVVLEATEDPRTTAHSIGLALGLSEHGDPENVMHDPPGGMLFESQWIELREKLSSTIACQSR